MEVHHPHYKLLSHLKSNPMGAYVVMFDQISRKCDPTWIHKINHHKLFPKADSWTCLKNQFMLDEDHIEKVTQV